MAHTKEQAQDFASRVGKLAPIVRELYTVMGEIEFNDNEFTGGAETVQAADFVGSAYEGFTPGAAKAAYDTLKSFLTTSRAALVKIGKFK